MAFLFVDYDQGAGGEYFCAHISKSPQCVPLTFTTYGNTNGRTKVNDVFGQEFLQFFPNLENIQTRKSTVEFSTDNLYCVVPTHRHSDLASELLDDVKTIRIQMPLEEKLFYHVKNQRVKKVLLAQEPSVEYFFGEIRTLKERTVNSNFLKDVRYGMTKVELELLRLNIPPTQENIDKLVNKLVEEKLPEPNFDYDLTIPYEDLVYRPDYVSSQLQQTFGIVITDPWLKKYSNDINAST